eukprot:scaffold25176_cov30-Tisochrysis_lutea.AAC.1
MCASFSTSILAASYVSPALSAAFFLARTSSETSSSVSLTLGPTRTTSGTHGAPDASSIPPAPPESRRRMRVTISSIAALEGAHTITWRGGVSASDRPSESHRSVKLAGAPAAARTPSIPVPGWRNQGAALASSCATPSPPSGAVVGARASPSGGGGGGSVLGPGARAVVPSCEVSNTERMPRIVLVFPVPGGPWMSVMPRPVSDMRMARSCERSKRSSIARISSADGRSDEAGGLRVCAFPGARSSSHRLRSRIE